MEFNEIYDVIIIGGGPAGLATAIRLGQLSDCSILLMEAQTFDQQRIGESCPPDTIALLDRLGVRAAFMADGHATCPGYASLWGHEKVGYNDFIVNPLGPAWRLNRFKFDTMLVAEAERQGVQIAVPFKFLKAEKRKLGGYVLHFQDVAQKQQHQAEARYVVDATGAKARFAKALGIEKTIEDQLFASVRFGQVDSGHFTQQTLIEARPYGWWYAALLPGNQLVCMVVTAKELVPYLQDEQFKGFQTALDETKFVGPSLGKLSISDTQYHTWPIYSGYLPQASGSDWLAVGDAASSYDPISAQGIYKGLSSGIEAGTRLAKVLESSRAIGADYTERIHQKYGIYWENRRYLYGLENRWSTQDFWRGRKT